MLAFLVASIPSPPSKSIGIGPLQLRAYGLAIAIGVLVAMWIAQRRYARRGGDPEDLRRTISTPSTTVVVPSQPSTRTVSRLARVRRRACHIR